MHYSLNQIILKLQEAATKHRQINTFGTGDVWEIANSKVEYPLMWVVLQPSQLLEKELRLNVSILLMDLVDPGEQNELEVLSDMLQVATDIRAYLMAPENEDFYYIDDNSLIESFTERFNDSVSGWKMDLIFRISELNDRCAIPLEEDGD